MLTCGIIAAAGLFITAFGSRLGGIVTGLIGIFLMMLKFAGIA